MHVFQTHVSEINIAFTDQNRRTSRVERGSGRKFHFCSDSKLSKLTPSEMTKKVKDDAVNEASSKAVSKYLEGKKLNFVNIPLFEKLLSMKGYSGPSGNNPGEVQPKSKTSADADNTGANVEAGKKSSEAALADESSKSEPSKSVHFEKNREAGIVNPAFQSSDIVEDSVKSDAGGDLAMNFGAATDNKVGESKPGESPMHRSTNDSASKRSETDVAESKHKEDCETHAANDEVDENPGVKPKVENRSDNNAGQDNERPCKENKNVMIGEAMDSDTFISIEAAVAHAHGEEASSDESNDEGQRAGLRKSGKVSLRKPCMHNQKHAPRMDGDRVRRRNSRRNIGGNRLYVGEPTLINLEGEVVIEKFQIEPETGFLNRVLADTTKGFIRDPPPSSESNLAGPSIVTGSHERNELHTNEAADAQNESQAAPEAGGRRGPRYSSEEVAFTLRSLLWDTNERKEESDNPASDGFLTGEDCQTTDGFQTADDGASECDSVGTHGDDFYDCEDATSLHEYAGLATSQSLLPAHQDVEGKGGDDYDGDDSDGSIVYDCTKTSESINVGDTLLEQTVVETAVNTKAAMQVDQIPSSAVGEQMDPGTAIGLTEDSNSRGESSRSPTMGLESLDSEQAETNRSPCDRQGGPSVSGGVQSTYTFEGDAEMEVNESILVTTGETQGDVALLSDDDGEGANGLAISDTIPRTSSPFASAANAESPANSGLMETKSSEDPKPAQAGKNEQVVGPEASAKKQVNVGNGPPGAANNVVLHELENLVQVLKNYSDPSVRHSIRQFAEERSRNRCLIQRKNLLLNAIAMSSKKTTRTFLHMLKEHMLRIKYIVHNEQGSSIPISEEVCTLVWDLPLTQFAKLETIVDDIAFIFDSPMAKIKTIPEVLYRADYELSTGMLQRQLQHELSRAGNR